MRSIIFGGECRGENIRSEVVFLVIFNLTPFFGNLQIFELITLVSRGINIEMEFENITGYFRNY